MKTAIALKTLLGAASLALPLSVFAESNVQSGAGTLTATAHVDFSIVIPQILYLRVGTGSSYNTGVLTSNPAVDLITFSPTAAQVGSGTALAGTGGDITGSTETAAIVSNFGTVTLTSTSSGALGDGAGDSIPFTQITTAATSNTFATTLAAPVLSNGAGSTVTITAPATKVIQADAKWAFSYANTTTPPAGTYGGVNVNNSRVIYTATMP
jgi:hypothetical protein